MRARVAGPRGCRIRRTARCRRRAWCRATCSRTGSAVGTTEPTGSIDGQGLRTATIAGDVRRPRAAGPVAAARGGADHDRCRRRPTAPARNAFGPRASRSVHREPTNTGPARPVRGTTNHVEGDVGLIASGAGVPTSGGNQMQTWNQAETYFQDTSPVTGSPERWSRIRRVPGCIPTVGKPVRQPRCRRATAASTAMADSGRRVPARRRRCRSGPLTASAPRTRRR